MRAANHLYHRTKNMNYEKEHRTSYEDMRRVMVQKMNVPEWLIIFYMSYAVSVHLCSTALIRLIISILY